MDLLSDEELAERVFEGDVAAFDVLCARFRGYVTTCCYRVLGDREAAEEVTQDTFLRVFRKIRYFLENSKKKNFKAWIGITARRLAINRLRQDRKRKGARANPSSFQLNDIQAPEESDPVRLLEAEEWRQMVWKAVEELPELTRACFIARYFRTMKGREIAKVYELSMNQVDYHLRRGRAIFESTIHKLTQNNKGHN